MSLTVAFPGTDTVFFTENGQWKHNMRKTEKEWKEKEFIVRLHILRHTFVKPPAKHYAPILFIKINM